jgi:serine/threonine protein phosphatase PrpC
VLSAFGISDKGHIRSTNEDCFAIREELGLLVVADGMGGHNAGEVAAHLAVDTVVDTVESARTLDVRSLAGVELLRGAVHAAHDRILETAIGAHHYAGMGTTIVAARAHAGWLTVAHAGDSRLYVWSAGRIRQLTRDDSWTASILDADPDANAAVLGRHPMRGVLTNVVGARTQTMVHVAEERLAGGEVLLLTTDGVHSVLTETWLERALAKDDDLPDLAARIVDGALRRGSRDNCTAIVARYS